MLDNVRKRICAPRHVLVIFRKCYVLFEKRFVNVNARYWCTQSLLSTTVVNSCKILESGTQEVQSKLYIEIDEPGRITLLHTLWCDIVSTNVSTVNVAEIQRVNTFFSSNYAEEESACNPNFCPTSCTISLARPVRVWTLVQRVFMLHWTFPSTLGWSRS